MLLMALETASVSLFSDRIKQEVPLMLFGLVAQLVRAADSQKLCAWARNPYVESPKFGGNPWQDV